ncbi:MAG: mitochondrial fission ELM1 family protein [Pseudomonadota bacterium]
MSNQLGPSVWMVSDGRAGHLAQAKAIARALFEPHNWLRIGHVPAAGHRTEPITLTPSAPWTWIPGPNWPACRRALPREQRTELSAPWPSVWIGVSRRVAPFSARMKAWSQGETLVIHLMDAGLSEGDVDLRVIPVHDQPSGTNLLQTKGAPAYFSPEDIEQAGQLFADLADDPKKSAVVLLGGDSKSFRFQTSDADRLKNAINELLAKGWRVRITGSRRTPAPIRARFRQWSDVRGVTYWDHPGDGPNPYLGWLAYADLAIVTEDSASMISEAAWFGLPVKIAPLSGRSAKFGRLHQSFIDHGAARWLDDDRDEVWSYPKLREAERVASTIIDLLEERFPRPEQDPQDGAVTLPDWL